MQRKYENLRGNSPIVSYEIQPSRIKIWLKDGKVLSYSNLTVGSENVEAMKKLAQKGAGLSKFITHKLSYNLDKFSFMTF